MNSKADIFFSKAKQWQKEYEKLREIILTCGLDEEIKWKHPCYTFNGSNIVLIHGFKEYCAILFFKGVLLKDTKNILVQQTENVQAGRQVRFTKLQDIVKLERVLKTYIYEAVEVEKAGLKIEKKKTADYKAPEELKEKLDESPAFKTAFEALTPGRQRAYILYFVAPKQSKTRTARIEKYTPFILAGKGLNDEYKTKKQ